MGTDCLLICGSNTTEAHPIVGQKVKEAAATGTTLIVVDPRRTEVAAIAEAQENGLFLQIRPGSNIPLLNAMLKVILDEGLVNREFIEARTEGFDALVSKLQDFSLEHAQEITGISLDIIRKAARLYAGSRRSLVLYGLGVAEHKGGTVGVISLANLVLATGHVGRPHTGINPLRGQNNVQGACDMGTLPYTLPGYQALDDESALEKFARAWRVSSLPSEPGLMEPEMYDQALKGRFRALYCVGYDPAHTQANINHVRKALSAMELVIVQDLFMTETAKYAHVVFPSACFYEKDGTFTSGERRVRRGYKAVAPVGKAKPDWKIISLFAQATGYPMFYNHPADIMDEIASLLPAYGGISYEDLGLQGQVWPCPEEGHPGTPLLHTERFPRGKASFVPTFYIPPEEYSDREYPFVLITGRVLQHYNNGSQTRHSIGFNLLVPEELVEINPADAKKLSIQDGDIVQVASRRGKVKVRVRVTERSQPGVVFMAFHHQDVLTNVLTSHGLDTKALTPEYKVCAVKIEKV